MPRDIRASLRSNSSLLNKIALTKGHINTYQTYNSLEDMFLSFDESEWEVQPLKSFWSLFWSILKSILIEFRKLDIFPSQDYISEALFRLLQNVSLTEIQTIDEVLNYVHINGLARPAIVVFPINAFGVEDIGIGSALRHQNLHFESKNMLAFTQQNNIVSAKHCLEIAKDRFRMSSLNLDNTLLDHFLRSRPLGWFHKNPLLISKVAFSSSNHYENEYYLVRYLEKNVSKMFLANTIIKAQHLPSRGGDFSTRVINNWETNDIYHYIVFTRQKNKLVPECIPIHRKLSNVLEISNLNMDIPISLGSNILRTIEKTFGRVDMVYRLSIGNPLC